MVTEAAIGQDSLCFICHSPRYSSHTSHIIASNIDTGRIALV